MTDDFRTSPDLISSGGAASPEVAALLRAMQTCRFDPSELAVSVESLSPADRQKALTALFEMLKERNTLLEVHDELGRQLELGPLIQSIVFHITEILEADRSSLFLI
ncbi:MAG TPA: hypothetical protein PKM25_10080, partial [Candidatus Ozemobacteraceae bacterium]|nr:hypothetical protein [Candidatus Ozemobacteraceae bacterium]